MMTPQEVANCTFAKAAFGGYNMAAVDTFLDKLTEDYSALYKENTALKSKLKVLADKTTEYREMEEAMRSTLLTAQRMANNMVAEAEQKRDAIIATAEQERRKRLGSLVEDTSREEERLAQVRRRVDQELAAQRKRLTAGQKELRDFIQSVQSVCQKELEFLEQLPELPVEEPVPATPTPAAPVPPKAPATAASAPIPTPAAKASAAPHTPTSPSSMTAAVEKKVQETVSAFAPTAPATLEDPFTDDTTPVPNANLNNALGNTKVLNLEDLQFGRNYNKN